MANSEKDRTQMQIYLKQKILPIITVLLLIQPIIDIATSLLVRFTDYSVTIGMIIRIAFLIIIIFYSLFVCQSKYKKSYVIYFILLIVYSIAYLVYMVSTKNMSVAFLEVKSLLKCVYLPILLLSFIMIFNEQKKIINPKKILITGLIYAALILFAVITGTGFFSYGHGKLGSAGWFYAANEVGTIVAIMFPVLVFAIISALKVFNVKKLILSLIVALVYIGVALNIGTKVPMIGMVITLGAVLLIHLIKWIIVKEKKLSVIISAVSLVMLIGLFFIIPYTAAGQNLNNHMANAGVSGINDFFDDDTVEDTNNFQDTVNKPDNSKNVIFSSRDVFLEQTATEVRNSPLIRRIFGSGYTKFEGNDIKINKSIEMDFHEIFYRAGILGFIIYFAPIVVVLFMTAVLFFKRFRCNILNDMAMGYTIGLVLCLGIAYIAGHVLTAPAVSIYVALFMASLFTMFKQPDDHALIEKE